MKRILAFALAIMVSGCLSDASEPESESNPTESMFMKAKDPFFMNATYDASTFDIEALSPVQYDVIMEEEWVAARDGKRMHNVVFRPDAEGTFPVFINFSPYWGNTAELGGDNFAKYMVDNFVPRGYVVVLSALRGTGHSEGCFQIGGDLEVSDLYDVTDHYANAPYSDGNIAMGGKSYDSTPQNGLVAKMPHEAVKGLFHVSGITDMYRYNYKDGVTSVNGAAFTPRYYVTQTFDETITGPTVDAELIGRTVDDVACPEFVEHIVHGEASALTGLKTDYWQEREWTEYIADSTWEGSMFFVHGFQDWNVKPDNILPWLNNLPESVHVYAYLHQDTVNGGHVYPMRNDWNLDMLRWMDATLKGIDTGILDENIYQLQGDDGIWRNTPDYLQESSEMDIVGGEVQTNATRLTGKVTVKGTVTPQTIDPIFTATLYTNQNGTRLWAGEAVARLVYQDGLYLPTPVVPGLPMEVEVEFFPLDAIGSSFEIEFGTGSIKNVVLYEGVSYDGPFSLTAIEMNADEGALKHQPVPTDCYAC